MYIKKQILTILLCVSFSIGFGQVSPPAMAMPNETNMSLVDTIIKITNHEEYFANYCTSKVVKVAKKDGWPQEKKDKVLRSIKFKYYVSTIYNSYASYSTDEMNTIIATLKLINQKAKNWTKMVLTNDMMQHNLDLFVDGLIESKYVTE